MVAWRLAFDSVGQRPPGRRALITQDADRSQQRLGVRLFEFACPRPALGAEPGLPPAARHGDNASVITLWAGNSEGPPVKAARGGR